MMKRKRKGQSHGPRAETRLSDSEVLGQKLFWFSYFTCFCGHMWHQLGLSTLNHQPSSPLCFSVLHKSLLSLFSSLDNGKRLLLCMNRTSSCLPHSKKTSAGHLQVWVFKKRCPCEHSWSFVAWTGSDFRSQLSDRTSSRRTRWF